MWLLIASELAVFGAGLIAFMSVRLTEPARFAAGAATLDRTAGALNALVLVTSGYAAARATRCAKAGARRACRLWLAGASALGVAFLLIKAREYGAHAAHGVSVETDAFFTFYYLLTGFHALHVLAGIVVFALVARSARPQPVEAGAQFWHMVDLVWVMIFPVIYLLP